MTGEVARGPLNSLNLFGTNKSRDTMGGKPRKDTPRDMRLKQNQKAERKEIGKGVIKQKKKTT